MISFNLKSSITIAVICFVLGCCTAFLLNGCNDNQQSAAIVKTKELEKEFSQKEESYQLRFGELQKKNISLQQELISTQAELFIIKAKTKSKERQINKRIAPKGMPAKELLKKSGGGLLAIDSSLSPCDSLVLEVTEYIEENAIKDSLYEVHISLQDSAIVTKDSIICMHESKYQDLKTSFKVSLVQQYQLEEANQNLSKKIKRQKKRSRAAALGGMIVTGIVSGLLLK